MTRRFLADARIRTRANSGPTHSQKQWRELLDSRIALRPVRAPATLAGYLSSLADYEVEPTGSEMVQWTPSASKAKVVRAPN